MRPASKWNRFHFVLSINFLLLFTLNGPASPQTKPIEGIRENTPQVHALINAKIVQAPGRVIENGAVVLRDGVIVAVGAQAAIPADARIWDYAGKTIYAGFIEPHSHLGLPKKEREPRPSAPEESNDLPQSSIDHWNDKVRSNHNVLKVYQPRKEDVEKLRALGFTAALIAPDDGVFRGASALVQLGDGDLNELVLRENVAQHISFDRGRPQERGSRTYPNSLMGVIALVRQTLLDAQWYEQANAAYHLNPVGQTKPETNEALAALDAVLQRSQPVIFEVENDLNFLRAQKIADEFKLNWLVRGSGYEYRILEKIKAAGVPLILPVNFPEAPKVETPEEALAVTLDELNHWEAAPVNPKWLQEVGIAFSFTSNGLKSPTEFPDRIRKSLDAGLSKDALLAALTMQPAKMLGVEQKLGSVDAGKLANLVVTDGELCSEKTKVLDVWIGGRPYEINKSSQTKVAGNWSLALTPDDGEPITLKLELKGEPEKLSGSIWRDSLKIDLQKVNLDDRRLVVSLKGDSLGHSGIIRMNGALTEQRIAGHGEFPNGNRFKWEAVWQSDAPKKDAESSPRSGSVSEKKTSAAELTRPSGFPPGAYGRREPPAQPNHILVRGATIWTCGPQGKIENADLLITQGKITRIAQNLTAPAGAIVIEAAGKHVTPGLIDAHSHTAISEGVNEGTQAVTAEVRIGDVVDSHDIAMYRELAGGLTAANQLHGSANPIGGQNSVIKLRWGSHPDDLKIADAPAGIKFALGENVKQSNWGEQFTTRYPQTRMGVEQIIRDRFKAALDYEKQWQEYNSLKSKRDIIPPRRDLELEALLEILRGKRLVHAHSYRQDEILMLVRVAEDFGFQIATFQHVLEGYKVAEALANHGAGASTFSDWWAYKFEVYDAIPYNGALMHDAGVLVSFNSDSDELARRMNLEAAKAVKYGGVAEEEALKFVTLNPAKQLRIDHRVGSLEPGKDADFVIWSGHPLSTYSICEQTWIEGRKYFDVEEDKVLREQITAERARLIQKVLANADKEKKGGEDRKPRLGQ
jgi:imidazolonepropionase-like amidohydrolase